MAGSIKKEHLIRLLRTAEGDRLREAVDEARERRWLMDGTLQGADLDQANFSGVDLSGVDLRGAALISTNLTGANLCGAHLQRANLRSAVLRHANLYQANLRRALLLEADLTGAQLDDAVLHGADLTRATLTGTVFNRADMLEAKLDEAVLCRADFSLAVLRYASFADADCFGVMLSRVDLSYAESLTEEQLSRAYALWESTLPDGSRYDGRYRLVGDEKALHHQHTYQAEEAFFGVSAEQYRVGQLWADEHLNGLRDEPSYQQRIQALWQSPNTELNGSSRESD